MNESRPELPEPIGATYTIAGIRHCTITRNGPDTELFTKEQVLACIVADRASGSSLAVPERQDLIRPEDLFVCGQMGVSITRVTLESSPSKEQV